jgi:glycosyltransferase involved in cell wall biosynthesis
VSPPEPAEISVVIPAYREAGRVGATVRAILTVLEAEVIVVDDGSPDGTADEAEDAGARIIHLPRNSGKGAALTAGLNEAQGAVLMMADADLGDSAAELARLVEPVLAGEADVAVAAFPVPAGHRGGFGLVKALARWGLRRAGAPPMSSPLSGQRALTRHAWERIGRLDPGYGAEMGLNLDAARLGLRVVEVPVTMTHRLTGRDLAGFRHRGRQFRDVLLAILRRSLFSPRRHRERSPRAGGDTEKFPDRIDTIDGI